MDNFKKIEGWFPDSNAEYLDRLIKDNKVQTVVEIGSFVGKSTVFFAERVKTVYAIDTFKGNDEDYIQGKTDRMWERFKKNTAWFKNIIPIREESTKATQRVNSADLIFIDGSHKYEDVKADILAWQDKGKILCGDDYHWPEVKKAVDELLNVITDGRIWLRK